MAVSVIKNSFIKTKTQEFTNVTQYSGGSYYFYITAVKAKCGLPSNARIINASLRGWTGLGTTPNVQLSGEDIILVLYTNGTTLTSESRLTIRLQYI